MPELLTTGGVLAALAAAVGGALFLWNRRRREREIEEQRQLAEREFAELTERMDEFGEKERLVAGYLEAQRRCWTSGAKRRWRRGYRTPAAPASAASSTRQHPTSPPTRGWPARR